MLHSTVPGSTGAAQATAAVKLRLTGHLTRAASWVQAQLAVPQSPDVGLLVEAEVAPLRRQLKQAHEQLAAQQLQIQVACLALCASESQLGLRPSLVFCVCPRCIVTDSYACLPSSACAHCCNLACSCYTQALQT